MRENIPALPMHDGLMVQQSAKHRAKIIMEEEATRIAGVRLPVAEKDSRIVRQREGMVPSKD